MLFPALVGAMYQEKTGFAYLIWGLLCIAAGLILCFRKPSNMEIYSRDGFVCVSLSWVVLGVFGAVPFVITGKFRFISMRCLRSFPVLQRQEPAF